MGEKITKGSIEVQLGFGFFPESEASIETLPAPARGSQSGLRSRHSLFRSTHSPLLSEILPVAQSALLEAPLSEVSAQLLPLFEFCEAALTRALDVVPTRTEELFSAEEYRSLRGIGQAQWLLAEAHSKRETPLTATRARKRKKVKHEG